MAKSMRTSPFIPCWWCFNVSNSFLFLPTGSQQKPAVAGLWSNHQNGEGLRRSQEVYVTDPLRPRRKADSVGTEQSAERSQCHLLLRRACGRHPKRNHVCAHGVRPKRQNHLPDICWWQILELYLPGEGMNNWIFVSCCFQFLLLYISEGNIVLLNDCHWSLQLLVNKLTDCKST